MVYSMSVSTAQIEGIIKKFRDAEEYYDTEARKGMQEATMLIERNVKTTMTERRAVNTGLSRKSVTSEIRGRALNMTGRIFSPLKHMMALEHSLKPGQVFPPPRAIERWIEQKGISSEKYTVAQLAFAIARTIKRKGTIKRFGYRGVEMFKIGFEKSKERITKIFDDINRRFVERFK